MMSKMRVFFFAMSVLMGVVLASSVLAGLPPIKLTEKDPASQSYMTRCPSETVGIGGSIFEGYCVLRDGIVRLASDAFATWRVPTGYYSFEAYCGIDDSWGKDASGTMEFLLDGDTVKSVNAYRGQKPVKVSFPVRPGQSIRISINTVGVVAEPRFLSEPADSSPVVAGTPSTTSSSSSGGAAPFVVEPRDLDTLAESLRKEITADAALSSRLNQSQLAVMTFELIDVPSRSVALNVAEDLYTSMIKAGFKLVERGQLDKALQELKIQNTGLIDPTTAQKVGRISGCDLILLGSISDRGGFVVVNARIMDTSTGKSVVAERVEMRKTAISR